MYMKGLMIFLTLLTIGYGCKNIKYVNDSDIVTFDLKELPEISSLKLSDLGFDDIEYIPLETNEQCMLLGTDNLIDKYRLEVGERFYIVKRFSNIWEFQTDGKFISKIGTIGRGPNEITAAHDVKINEKDQKIYLLARWQKKFFIYSENGKLIKTIQIPFLPSEFQFTEGEILCYSENHMGDVQNSYTLIDTNGIVKKDFPNKYPFKNHDAYVVEAENIFYKFNNRLFKKEVYSDTIYVYKNENFTPHLVVQVGEKLLSPEARTEFDGFYLAKNYIIPLNLFEFGDFIYYEFIYRYVIPDNVLIYSLIGSKKNNYQAVINTGQGLINDLDGGPNILPMTIKDDSTIIGWVDALKLKAHVASEVFKNSTPKYPEKKKELEKLAASLKETDNPVLILVRLKEGI